MGFGFWNFIWCTGLARIGMLGFTHEGTSKSSLRSAETLEESACKYEAPDGLYSTALIAGYCRHHVQVPYADGETLGVPRLII